MCITRIEWEPRDRARHKHTDSTSGPWGALVVASLAAACGGDAPTEPDLLPPSGLTAEVTSGGVVHLKWDPVPGASSYVIQRAGAFGDWGEPVYRFVDVGFRNNTTFDDRGPLRPGFEYRYRVAAEAGRFRSYSGVVLVTVASAPLGRYPDMTGVYDLTALSTDFDAGWGDLTGTRQTAVLAIEHDTDIPRFAGSVADFRAVFPSGETDSGSPGSVGGTIDRDGRVIVALTLWGSQGSYWYGEVCCRLIRSRRSSGQGATSRDPSPQTQANGMMQSGQSASRGPRDSY